MEGPHRHAGTVLTLGDQVAALGLLARPDDYTRRQKYTPTNQTGDNPEQQSGRGRAPRGVAVLYALHDALLPGTGGNSASAWSNQPSNPTTPTGTQGTDP